MNTVVFERICLLCRERGMTLKAFSEGLGLSDSLLRKWKTGTTPGADKLCAIADFFSVSVDFLLGRSEFRGGAEQLLQDGQLLDLQRVREHMTPQQREQMMKLLHLIYEREFEDSFS